MRIVDEGCILAIYWTDNDLIIRLDCCFALPEATVDDLPVRVLTIQNPTQTSILQTAMEGSVGHNLYYEASIDESEKAFVCLNYDNWYEIECAGFEYKQEDYTREDLLLKCQRLSKEYSATVNQESQLRKQFHAIRHGLHEDIRKEIDRCDRKLEFYEQVHDSRAPQLAAELKAYERVLNLMDYYMEDQAPRAD